MKMYNFKMKKIYLFLFIFFVSICFGTSSFSCNLLNISIGSDKSSLENVFGDMENFGEIEDTSVTINTSEATRNNNAEVMGEVLIYDSTVDAFCEEVDFGEVLIRGYVVNNKIGAFEIEVQNGPDNDQSNQGLLNNYVQANFGSIDTNDKDWPGYKIWNIDDKQIYYYKIKNTLGEIQEGVAVTNQKYSGVLIEQED